MIVPTPLRASRIVEACNSTRFTAGLHLLGLVDSTNDLAASLARRGADDGTVVIAEGQISGRGRRGTKWVSTPGCGIYASVVLRRPPPAGTSPLVSVACGLAAAAAIARTCGLTPRMKWPNDVWVDQRKVAGILIDVLDPAAGLAIAGFGITTARSLELASAEAGIVAPAALSDFLTGPPSRERLAAALLDELDARLDAVESNPAALASEFKERDVLLGRRVVIEEGCDLKAGVVREIDPVLGLTLETAPGQVVRIRAEHARIIGVDLASATSPDSA